MPPEKPERDIKPRVAMGMAVGSVEEKAVVPTAARGAAFLRKAVPGCLHPPEQARAETEQGSPEGGEGPPQLARGRGP